MQLSEQLRFAAVIAFAVAVVVVAVIVVVAVDFHYHHAYFSAICCKHVPNVHLFHRAYTYGSVQDIDSYSNARNSHKNDKGSKHFEDRLQQQCYRETVVPSYSPLDA